MELMAPEAESDPDYLDHLSKATDAMENSDAWIAMENGLSIAKRLNIGDDSATGVATLPRTCSIDKFPPWWRREEETWARSSSLTRP